MTNLGDMAAESSRFAADPAATSVSRADARANRERIVEAARAVLVTKGLTAPMSVVARRAGVGVATLYRHFPTRTSLITEVFTDQVEACAGAVDEGLADADPWRGFCRTVTALAGMQVSDRGFTAAFLTEFPDAVDLDRQRAEALRRFDELVERAKKAGRLRADFHREDLVLVLMANDGLVSAEPPTAAAASRRFIAYLLQSFRADNAAPLPPPVPLAHEHPRVHR